MFMFILSIFFFGIFLYFFLKLDANPLLAFYEKFFPNTHRLKGKTVWIVGASTGIGEAVAYQLAELNCRLILTATTEERLNQVKESCLKKSSNLKEDDILVLAYDISDFEKNDAAFKKIIQKFDNIDILVTNAAKVANSKVTDDDFMITRKIFDINYFAAVKITKIVVNHWISKNFKGQIMATSSVGAYFDFPFFQSYTGSKRAMNAFYRDLAQQVQSKGIIVSLALPGPVKTEIFEKQILGEKGLKAKFKDENWTFMTSKRCSSLMLIALANKLNESWISTQPMLLMTYISLVFNYQIHYLFRLFDGNRWAEKYFF